MRTERIWGEVILGFFLLFNLAGNAQPYFYRNDSVEVKINGSYIANPWAGGLNFVQLSNIDMDLDGVKDLFVFDRTGNKVRAFLNKGTANTTNYVHAPWLESRYPAMHDWALLADYNCDGKEDIFTYTNGGFAVYKNISDIANGLQFQLVTSLVRSVYIPPNGTPYNLYVSSVDVPAITDIDNDGDLDIVTFGILGSYIEYHQNQSMDSFGVCDSLVFHLKNACWGYASENALNNSFMLYDTCMGNVPNPGIVTNAATDSRSADRHAGSCVLCLDLDGDMDKELITGDISFSTLTMLTNGGSPHAASMVAVDVDFPANNSNTTAVDLDIFPCGYYVDVNNDQIKDLVVSPNAPNVSENFNSLVYYRNNGTNNFPDFQYQQPNLLQDSMIEVGEGAYPAFFDYNADGLQDLFIGNYGYYGSSGYHHSIALFKNTGTTTTPKFELVTRDYANLSGLGVVNMIPAFGDLDADGDSDMIIGSYDGKLHYFENNALPGDTAHFVLVQANLRNSQNRVIDVGDFAAPQIFDIDGDNKNDLVIGARNGRVAYYNHTGSATANPPVMDSVSHYWGNVKVNAPYYVTGYAYPFVFKQNGVTKILFGTESGYLMLYDNIDGNLNGTFNRVDSTYLGIREGARSAPAGKDITGDGLMDMVLGNYAGGVAFYKGTTDVVQGIVNNASTPAFTWNVDLFPNPANGTLTVQIKNNVNALYTVELYSAVGQLVVSETFSDSRYTLHTASLSAGVYICKINQSNDSGVYHHSLVKRVVIQH